ncbi:MAG: hypothetical protein JSV16_05625 [Candidatus Hydrogenedentota bacterium]|nr:MAG: hypothetical protein JSV16_05625 [Candidatus Hydrogenedentota bacterium]
MRKAVTIFLVSVVAFGVVACASYYQVKDPLGGNVYYTQKIKERKSGITFKDAKTGSTVTLQSSEVRKIPKEEYKLGVRSSD